MNALDMPNAPLLDQAALAQLQRRMHGELLTPDQEAYEAALRAHTERNSPRPALIARCLTVHDIVLAIVFARERKLTVAVHSRSAGAADLLLDLSPMRQIVVDPLQRIARVQSGATTEEFAQAAAAYGLGGAAVLAVESVTAEGAIVTASAGEHADLFWATRDGGIIVAVTYRLRPLDGE